jgi:Na+/H+-dicarboxylate symporter
MRFFWLLLVALGLGTKRHWHILFAILLGLSLGLVFADARYAVLHEIFETVGQVFIRLVSMVVIPLVISSLIIGVTSVGDSRQLGRMGGKVLFWFIIFMAISALLGAGLAFALEPGLALRDAIQANPESINSLIQHFSQHLPGIAAQQALGWRDLLFNILPENIFQSLVQMQLVPVIFFTLFFGVALSFIGEAGRPLVSLFESIFTTTMKLTDWIMVLAVPGVFAITFTAVSTTPQVFSLLAPLAMATFLGLLLQALVVFPLALRLLARVDALNLYRAISEAIMVAFGTASSSATLPVTIACCERRAGISNRIASFVLPTGASINKTGTTMFEALAVIFLAQAYGTPLPPIAIVMTVLFSLFASIAAPGIPSAGLITMGIVVNSLGPQYAPILGGIALLWPFDRVLDMCRTTVNVMSSCTVAALVAASEGELNRDTLNNRDAWTEVV